jgi:hypothetical protein
MENGVKRENGVGKWSKEGNGVGKWCCTRTIPLGTPQLLPSEYGDFNITRRTSQISTSATMGRINSVHFWSATVTGSGVDLGELACSKHHSGMT